MCISKTLSVYNYDKNLHIENIPLCRTLNVLPAPLPFLGCTILLRLDLPLTFFLLYLTESSIPVLMELADMLLS